MTRRATAPSRFYLSGLDLISADGQPQTFVHWLSLDDPAHSGAYAVMDAGVDDAFGALAQALPTQRTATTDEDPIDPALNHELWTCPGRSRELLAPLAEAFLAPLLTAAHAADKDSHLRLIVHPGERWARIPWELLPIDDERLLLDVAETVFAVAPPLIQHRARTPRPKAPLHPALYVIDPDGPDHVLTSEGADRWNTRIRDAPGARFPAQSEVNRGQLSQALRATPPPGRLVFMGHCSAPGPDGTAHRAGLVLSDDDRVDGLEGPVWLGGGRPLSALDLFLGDAGTGDGPQRWPMPARVGLIACSSGTDQMNHEALGLVAALVNAGAEYVTATRWVLPADHRCDNATSNLAEAVDDAHAATDPVSAMTRWMRDRLSDWRNQPTELRQSPLLWSSTSTFHAPASAKAPASS